MDIEAEEYVNKHKRKYKKFEQELVEKSKNPVFSEFIAYMEQLTRGKKQDEFVRYFLHFHIDITSKIVDYYTELFKERRNDRGRAPSS